MTRPTLAEAIKRLRSAFRLIRVRNLIDVCTWGTDPAAGRLKPTTKGFAAELRHPPKLVWALAKAESRARELGQLASDGGDAQ